MPSENTHLYLADRIRREINDEGQKQLISRHLDYYFLGSIFPDILFYSKKKELSTMARHLHGEDTVLTNRIVFELLDEIKSEENERNLAFVFGFLTHYAADITFHPIVFYLSGYQPGGSPREMNKSSYLHWHYETDIDKQVNDRFSLHRIIHPEIVKNLIVHRILGIRQREIGKALERQMRYSSVLKSRFYHAVFKGLCKLGVYPAGVYAGFYPNLEKDPIRFPGSISYKDLISGEPKQTTLTNLVATTIQFGCRMIETAHAYSTGQIHRDECEKVIAGQSLETGQIGKLTSDIRFSARKQTAPRSKA